ncbi:threonine dehydratase, partial [Streptomyces sp. SID10244]|nr:threonine dehydratase [Streptomyces sp. SID10244]
MESVSTQEASVHQHGPTLTADAITASVARIAEAVARTPLEESPRISADAGARVFLKREDLQTVRSY